MSAEQLLTYLTWGIYVLIFYHVVAQAVRSPGRVNVNIALFFALPAVVIAIGTAAAVGLIAPSPLTNAINSTLILALAYVLLLLVDDFADVPSFLARGAAVALLLLAAGSFLFSPPRPGWLTFLQIVYFIGLQLYAAVMFVRASRRSAGVTQRRLTMVALGSLFLGVTILLSGLRSLLRPQADLLSLLTQVAALASGICYFIGFSPPAILRRAWQEPELRAFLSRAAKLPRLPETQMIVEELQRGAAASTGAPYGQIGLWDDEAQVLRFIIGGRAFEFSPDERTPAGKAFLDQHATFSNRVVWDDPDYAEVNQDYTTFAVLAAPITADEKRLGVLTVYAPHAPIFAEDDLMLVQLLADQAAVILESRALVDEAARVQAQEETVRLKDDFLSAAAHDLRTPLTTLMGQAQLMKMRAERNPNAPADMRGLVRIEQEARRLAALVNELLDARRAEQGQLIGHKEQVDLVELASASCKRFRNSRNACIVDGDKPVIGWYDHVRIAQLFDNLLENAMKYSPDGGDIQVKVWQEDGEARISVADQGIGIPAADLPRLFDRFYRGGNVNDRRFAGMGLGLYICRAIVEAHGGHIWATSRQGKGSIFHVALPVANDVIVKKDEVPPLAKEVPSS